MSDRQCWDGCKKNDGPTTKADRREAKKRFSRRSRIIVVPASLDRAPARPRTHAVDTHAAETMLTARPRPAKPREAARRPVDPARRRAPFALLVALFAAMTLSPANAASASATYDPTKCNDKDVVAPLGLACQTALVDSSAMADCCAALTTWNAAGCNCPAVDGETLLDSDEYSLFKPQLASLNAGCGIDAADDDTDAMCVPPSPPPSPIPPPSSPSPPPDASSSLVEDVAAGASGAGAASLAAAVAAAFVATALVVA